MYDGGLNLANGECRLMVKHVVQDGYVITYAILNKKVDDQDISKQLGVLYDKDIGYNQDMVTAYYDSTTNMYKGRNMGEDGIIDMSSNHYGNLVFILKNIDSGYNNVNSFWTDVSTWKNNQFIAENVG